MIRKIDGHEFESMGTNSSHRLLLYVSNVIISID
jgi:hypothetical protein